MYFVLLVCFFVINIELYECDFNFNDLQVIVW